MCFGPIVALVNWEIVYPFEKQTGKERTMNPHGKIDDYVKLAAKDAEKASETVAKSFYKILKRNGFTDAQVINVASTIIDCLTQTLEQYKDKKGIKEKSSENIGKGNSTMTGEQLM
jgi:hypothetical protein